MKNSSSHDPKTAPPADGPLARLVDDQEGPQNPAPGSTLPQPPEAQHGGRNDYADGTPEHGDDREM